MSHKGHDDSKCGVNHHPCHTLSYTLEQRAKDDDVIQINGQDGTPYPIGKQHMILRNITLIGTEGRARIAGEFSVLASYLFVDVARGLNTSPEQVSINLVNLKLIKIGIIKLKNTLITLNVQVVDCMVSKLSKSPIVDSSAAKTTVIFKKSIIRHVSKGLEVKSKELSLSMESSKIENSGGSYPGQDCPQFIVTHDFESLVAYFSKSSFKYTFLIDLAASRRKKSNVSIIDSIFDEDNKNVKHNGCFSGITLRNTTALIVNSNFTNVISKKSLIKAIASFVTFKQCVFSNISSKLGMFSRSSSIIASFNKTNAINNKLNRFNYGTIYLQSTKGIFQNCTLHNNTVNGHYGNGGAMYMRSSNITVQQCLFKENTVTYSGGAIRMVKTRGIFVNCTFEKNSVKSRLQIADFGGAVCASDNSQLTMHQCIFKKNTATCTGGAIYIHKSHSLFESCIFKRNKVYSPNHNTIGGAISALGAGTNITIKQCLFKENAATYGGGAIDIENSRVFYLKNRTFVRNTVKTLKGNGSGGAIFSIRSSDITVQQCLFKENTATDSGGAIFMQETRGSFENCTFDRNSIKGRLQKQGFSGALCALVNSHLTMHQCIFKENTATDSGGAIFMQQTRGSFENCTFDRNSVKGRLQKQDFGGALCALGNSHLTMHQCIFKENTAIYSGGAIFMQEARGSFENCTFDRNSVKGRPQKQDFGGALCALGNSHLTMHQCIFKENTAIYSGGAIFMQETRGSFENCTFDSNSVKSPLQKADFGGAVSALENSHLTMHQCFLKENTATYTGGATYIWKSHSLFESCIFERNKVNNLQHHTEGGAISATGAGTNITIKQCLFKENTAACSGGAISMQWALGLFVNCTFGRNSVKSRLQKDDFGGAICATNNSHLTVHQCIFKDNTATYVDGATYIQESQVLFESCIFERNKVYSLNHDTTGGAISALGAGTNVTIKKCLFKENAATYGGGAIDIETSRVFYLKNRTFVRNTVQTLKGNGSGGAIVSIRSSDITVQQCLFKENTATDSGGAIFMQETRGSFENCTFDRNFVKGRLRKQGFGGALCALSNSHLAMHQCIFKGNTAIYSGGAIFMQETQGSFENCTFVGNAVQHLQGATFGGAISFIKGSFYLMTQCIFMKNTATIFGGACYIQNSHSSFEKCTFQGKV